MLLFKNKITVFLGLMLIMGGMYFYPNDWMGWFLLGGSFYFIDRMKLDSQTKGILLFILFIHQIIALYYFIKYPGYVEDIDFTTFQLTAKSIADGNYFSFGTDAAFFSNLLALFYKINNSQLFGQEISLLMFMTSCFILMRIVRYYQLDTYTIPILLLYALSPASLLWTNIILREPFELTFLLLAIECLLCFKSGGFKISTRLLYLGGSFLLILYMCLLHKGLFFCLPVFFFIALVLPAKDKNGQQIVAKLIQPKKLKQYISLIYLPFVLLLIIVFTGINKGQLEQKNINSSNIIYNNNYMTVEVAKDLSQTISSLGIYKTVAKFRYGDVEVLSPEYMASLFNATTNYDKGNFVPKNLFQFSYMALREYLNYAFLPAVLVTGKWTLLNLILSFIYVARLLFFCSAIKLSMDFYKKSIKSPLILISLYFIVSFIFSLGTIAYGTAMRHNLMTDWILILLGTPLIYDFATQLFKKLAWRRNILKLQRV
ncbi:Uncharacterised protein [Legionella steigerwaltii]|uniref:Glycosyltransferase RgtA/B/C/D-like domain-containing protein n=1 Tax=Legionella steigerwaltii TaxID=460 RepID=A0A378LC04_9GAMM|nr:hypothetical protein [Legionella steigerwaltii]KTD77130.1 hypothetical protein Lstg_2222 [Legionella steigerwaltii]STY21621.1 Uncharacterised protein [Legionella steigerwaltii]